MEVKPPRGTSRIRNRGRSPPTRRPGGYRTFEGARDGSGSGHPAGQGLEGLRGRGVAGFPTGMEVGLRPKGTEKPELPLCGDADESRRNVRDRYLLEKDPHALIEGIIITCWAVGIHHAYVYIRGEFGLPYYRLRDAVQEAYDKGYLGTNVGGKGFQLDSITIHRGAGAYICGEETGLIESLEGKKGQPSQAALPGRDRGFRLSDRGQQRGDDPGRDLDPRTDAAEYKKYGTEKSPGTKLFSVSSHEPTGRLPGIHWMRTTVGTLICQPLRSSGSGLWKMTLVALFVAGC
ncbi:MAG: hypothetical protein R3E12_19595 [Candidatus Eisenbacteria bacterium]